MNNSKVGSTERRKAKSKLKDGKNKTKQNKTKQKQKQKKKKNATLYHVLKNYMYWLQNLSLL